MSDGCVGSRHVWAHGRKMPYVDRCECGAVLMTPTRRVELDKQGVWVDHRPVEQREGGWP